MYRYIVHGGSTPYEKFSSSRKLLLYICSGWTVFQRRTDGSTNFYRDWEAYRIGFGNLANEFWLGNSNIHDLTAQSESKGNELRVEMTSWENKSAYAKYSTFAVDDEKNKYKLTVENYSGTLY